MGLWLWYTPKIEGEEDSCPVFSPRYGAETGWQAVEGTPHVYGSFNAHDWPDAYEEFLPTRPIVVDA